jgi:hypothetical protein
LTYVAQLSIAVIPEIDCNDVVTNVDELNRTDSRARRKTGWLDYWNALDEFGKIHGVDLVDGINMDEDQNTVYRENRFSVDFEENPMFMRVKQGSLFCDQDEFGEELDLRTAVDLTVVDPAVDHGVPFGLTDAQLGVEADYFDFDGWLGFVEETHR